MARSMSVSRLAALLLSTAAALVSAQSSTSSPSSTITSAPSGTTASASTITGSTSSDIPLSLWSLADSLLSEYYPSTSLTDIQTLTFPATVVIGSSTISVHPAGSATSTSVLAEQTSAPGQSSSSKGLSSDEKLGIVVGVVIGTITLAVLGIVLFCLWRRPKRTGSLFLRRPSPSVAESDIGDWRTPQPLVNGPARGSRDWVDSYNRLPEQPAPPMAMHPAYVRQHSSRSTSEENPFFTPQERSEAQLGHYDTDAAGAFHKEIDNSDSSYRSSGSAQRTSRPLTPFAPTMMTGAGLHQPQRDHNPFSSPDDDEADDIVSPIIPTRSPERRHSPMVHYPSWNEVSEFDFSGEGRGRSAMGHSGSDESGDDGWRGSRRESVIGRHELA